MRKILRRSGLQLVLVIAILMATSVAAFAAPPPGTPGEDQWSDMAPTPVVTEICCGEGVDLSHYAPLVRMFAISCVNTDGVEDSETTFEMAFVSPELAARYYNGELTEWPSPEQIVASASVKGGTYAETLPAWWELCATLWGEIYG